jgi:hypothetical protein
MQGLTSKLQAMQNAEKHEYVFVKKTKNSLWYKHKTIKKDKAEITLFPDGSATFKMIVKR